MRRLSFVPFLAIAAILLFSPLQLRADGLDFSFTEISPVLGPVSITWNLPQYAATAPGFSVYPGGGGFEVANVLATYKALGTSTPLNSDLYFFTSSSGVGFEFLDFTGPFILSGVPTLFSNGFTNPVFTPGTYKGTDPLWGVSATLKIVNTPEPSSILLLLTGFLALGGFLALKKASA